MRSNPFVDREAEGAEEAVEDAVDLLRAIGELTPHLHRYPGMTLGEAAEAARRDGLLT